MLGIKFGNLFLLFLFSNHLLFAQQDTARKPAAESAQAMADKLANPVANMISVPLQNNTDVGIGQFNGSKNTLNIQPVFPIVISPRVNLITRVILPLVSQQDISGEGKNEFGLSDATITGFFAPTNTKNGLIWAAGPAILVPTGTSEYLSTRKWAMGPSVLILKQATGLTYGFLANQLWSFAGDKNRSDVNQMFFQPFITHNFKSGAGLGGNAEMTFNWQAGTTSIFFNPIVSGVTKLGKQIVSIAVGPRIPLDGTSATRPNFGYRGVLTFVFPK